MKDSFSAVACVGFGALAVICSCFGPMPALGRAPGNFNNPPGVTAWFNSATSKISRCCDESDGEEWAAKDDESHPYKVRILGKWVDVPEAALLIRDREHGPNPTGTAIVWLWWLNDGEPQTRCFAPGDE